MMFSHPTPKRLPLVPLLAPLCLGLSACGGAIDTLFTASSSASSQASSASSTSSPASSLSSASVPASASSAPASSSASLASSSAAPLVSLLTSDGTFTAGAQNFIGYFTDRNSSATFNGVFSATLGTATAETWEAQLQHGVALQAGQSYALCFDGKASAARDIFINMDKGGTPDYASLSGGGISKTLSTDMQSFRYTFTASDTDATARITFNIGKSTIGVQLDNIGLYKGHSCPNWVEKPEQIATCDLPLPAPAPKGTPQGVNLNAPKTEPMIPKWGLGYMQSQWGYNLNDGKNFNYDTQEGFLNHARALRGLDNPNGAHLHPADVLVLDMYWCGGQVEGYSCWEWPNNMKWDLIKYPNPKAMFEELHKMNFKVMMNYHAGGFKTNEQEWLAAMQSHFEMGLDMPWLDFWGRDAYSEGKVWSLLGNHLGADKRRMYMGRHLALPNTENAEGGSFDANGIFQNDGVGKIKYPDEDPIEKTMPVHWTGDVEGTWVGLEQTIESIVYGQDGAMGGWSYLHSDTPGHSKVIGEKDKELAVRWIQFSDFSTTTRNHGWAPRMVWSWGKEAEEASYFSRMLRYRLLPYTYTYIHKIWDQAIPLTMPMKFAYPGQADDLKYQFMFGDELLVAPVYTSSASLGGKLEVFLPKGEQWVDYWTHKVYSGNQTIKADVSMARLKYVPLYVKRGAIIPMGPEIFHIDPAKHPDPLTLDIYPKCSGKSTFTLYDDDGETLGYQRGAFAKTEFSVEKTGGRLNLNLGASVGQYTGKPSNQNYLLKINLIDSPYQNVTLNGTPLAMATDFNTVLKPGNTPAWGLDSVKNILYVRFTTASSASNSVVITP